MPPEEQKPASSRSDPLSLSIYALRLRLFSDGRKRFALSAQRNGEEKPNVGRRQQKRFFLVVRVLRLVVSCRISRSPSHQKPNAIPGTEKNQAVRGTPRRHVLLIHSSRDSTATNAMLMQTASGPRDTFKHRPWPRPPGARPAACLGFEDPNSTARRGAASSESAPTT